MELDKYEMLEYWNNGQETLGPFIPFISMIQKGEVSNPMKNWDVNPGG